MSEPGWNPDDRRGWRYGIGGRPLELAICFVDRLCGRNSFDVSVMCTRSSLETWERYFRDDWKADEWLQKSLASSMTIRYPAPGMAFVFFLLSHPDQTEPYTIEKETKASIEAVTLHYDEQIHDWRVHAVGAMGPPSDLGLVPFTPT